MLILLAAEVSAAAVMTRSFPASPVTLSAGHRWLVIPGATGQPRDGNPAACYAIFETERSAVTFHRVAYDHEAAAAKIRAAGLPERLADRLVDGE